MPLFEKRGGGSVVTLSTGQPASVSELQRDGRCQSGTRRTVRYLAAGRRPQRRSRERGVRRPDQDVAAAGIKGFSNILHVRRSSALRRNVETSEVAEASAFPLRMRPGHHRRGAHGRLRYHVTGM